MNRIASTAAHAPYAQVVVASGPAWTLPTAFLGLLWLYLSKGRVRWLGLPFALAVTPAPKPTPPEAWVSADGAAVAVRSGPDAVLMRPDVKLFGAELWTRRRGLTPLETEAQRDTAFECDHWSCAHGPGAPVKLSAAWNVSGEECETTAEAGAAGGAVFERRGRRAAQRFQAGALSGGAGADRVGRGWRLAWAQDRRRRRPWT